MTDREIIVQGFRLFSEYNLNRCEAIYHPLNYLSPSEYGNDLAGEVGEALNFVKKIRRGDYLRNPIIGRNNVAKELGDVITYADLFAQRQDISLGDAVVDKFNEVSLRSPNGLLIR